ncbi:hypothetical protein Salat_2779400, partial [Sesamum alatum]
IFPCIRRTLRLLTLRIENGDRILSMHILSEPVQNIFESFPGLRFPIRIEVARKRSNSCSVSLAQTVATDGERFLAQNKCIFEQLVLFTGVNLWTVALVFCVPFVEFLITEKWKRFVGLEVFGV